MPTDLSLHRAALAPYPPSAPPPAPGLRSHLPALAVIALYVAVSLIYAALSQAPWDDDCVGRYFNTVKAWHDPGQIFSLWNRPLFVLLFMPTALLGKAAMTLQMVLVAAFAGWMLYLAVRRMGAANAFMVLPFFFFQTYFFSTSRNYLTEPLAVALICTGLYALTHRRYLLFALMGGLLPLARLELSVLLPIWALVLGLERKWRYAAWLFVPALLLMVSGYFVRGEGGLFWLVTDTLGADNDKNRYGHTGLWHYAQRFGFVIGPVVLLFFTVGLLERVARRRMDLFIVLQMAGIFMLYTLFSWKLNMGNAAGFLRNLIPLTPFIAVIALDGFNAWAEVLRKPAAEAAPTVRPRKGRAPAVDPDRARRIRTWRVIAWSLLALWLAFHFFSFILRSHHKITAATTYRGAIITAGVVAVLCILLLMRRAAMRWAVPLAAVLTTAAATAYTLVNEPPDAHLNPERKTLNRLAALFRDERLKAFPLYCDNLWFFWTYDLGYPSPRFRTLTQANVEAAPPHALFLWENHYSNRLGYDASIESMEKRKDLVELCRAVSDDQAFTAVLYQKVDPVRNDGEELSSAFAAMFPDLPYIHCSRALRASMAHRNEEAIEHVRKMLALDSTSAYAHLVAGMVDYNAGRFDPAIVQYKQALALDTGAYSAYLNIGMCLQRSGDVKEAVPYFKKAVFKDKKSLQARQALANAYYQLKDYGQAYTAFSDAIRVAPKSGVDYMGRGNCCFQTGRYKEALAEYDQSLKVQPKQTAVLRNKGLTLLQLGRKAEACAQFQEALALGDTEASRYLQASCR